MKVMISQPLAFKTKEEIVATRKKAMEYLQNLGHEIVNTCYTDDCYSKESMEKRGVVNVPLCYLAKSLDNMSKSHIAYFAKGWENARGCKLEHEVAKAYGLQIMYEDNIMG